MRGAKHRCPGCSRDCLCECPFCSALYVNAYGALRERSLAQRLMRAENIPVEPARGNTCVREALSRCLGEVRRMGSLCRCEADLFRKRCVRLCVCVCACM